MRFGETLFSICKVDNSYHFYVGSHKGYFHIMYDGSISINKVHTKLYGGSENRVSWLQVPKYVLRDVIRSSRWIFEDDDISFREVRRRKSM